MSGGDHASSPRVAVQARLADRIVVMRDGAVAEQGSHEELIAARGLYFQLLSGGELEEVDGSEAEDDAVQRAEEVAV